MLPAILFTLRWTLIPTTDVTDSERKAVANNFGKDSVNVARRSCDSTRQLGWVVVVGTSIAALLMISFCNFLTSLEFKHAAPYRTSGLPQLSQIHSTVYPASWAIVPLAVTAGCVIVSRRSNLATLAAYVFSIGNLLLGWMLFTLLSLYLANQTFVWRL
jgi:hypothetical protein